MSWCVSHAASSTWDAENEIVKGTLLTPSFGRLTQLVPLSAPTRAIVGTPRYRGFICKARTSLAQAQRQVQSDHNADGKARNLCSAKPRAGAADKFVRVFTAIRLRTVDGSCSYRVSRIAKLAGRRRLALIEAQKFRAQSTPQASSPTKPKCVF